MIWFSGEAIFLIGPTRDHHLISTKQFSELFCISTHVYLSCLFGACKHLNSVNICIFPNDQILPGTSSYILHFVILFLPFGWCKHFNSVNICILPNHQIYPVMGLYVTLQFNCHALGRVWTFKLDKYLHITESSNFTWRGILYYILMYLLSFESIPISSLITPRQI